MKTKSTDSDSSGNLRASPTRMSSLHETGLMSNATHFLFRALATSTKVPLPAMASRTVPPIFV